MEGRHVGLDFYDLLIEAIWRWSMSAIFRELKMVASNSAHNRPVNWSMIGRTLLTWSVTESGRV